MLYGKYPFFGLSISQIYACIKKGSGKNLHLDPKVKISGEMKLLIQRILEMNPQKRISWEEFFCHSIFKRGLNQDDIPKTNFAKEILESNFNPELIYKKYEQKIQQKNYSQRDVFSYIKDGISDPKVQESYFMSIKNTPKSKNNTISTPKKNSSYGQVSTNKYSSDQQINSDNDDKITHKRNKVSRPNTNNEYYSNNENYIRDISPFKKKKIDYTNSIDKNFKTYSRADAFKQQLDDIDNKYKHQSIK